MRNKTTLSLLAILLVASLLVIYAKERSGSSETPNPRIQEKGLDTRVIPSLSGLIKAIKPCVVNISTESVIEGPSLDERFFGPFKDFFGDDFFDRFFGDIPRRQFKTRSLGSGFIIDKEGYILTNNHVVEKAQQIKVKLTDGKEYDAKIIGRDPKTDIALIKVSAKNSLPVATLGDSDKLEVGDWVIAIGNPFGLEHTVTVGIVSAKGRVIGAGPYDDFIQTDASINPGNSGGPLFNLNGEVVGINTAIISGGQGIGFAIPINMAKELLPQLKSRGKVVRGWLGVVIQKVTPDIAKKFALSEAEGALVSDVMEDSPAEKAGIRVGDVIVSYDGKKIGDMETLPRLVATTPIGKKVKVEIIRDGKRMVLDVTIAELKEEAAKISLRPETERNLGLVVQNITPDIARHLNLKDRKGVIVTDVDPNSVAAEAGIRPQDIIREVDKRPINSVKEFRDAISRANLREGIIFLIRRGERSFYVVVKE